VDIHSDRHSSCSGPQWDYVLNNPIVEYCCFYLSYLATAVQLTANGITHRPTQVFVYRSVAQKLGYVPRVPDFPGYPGRCWELPIFMEKHCIN